MNKHTLFSHSKLKLKYYPFDLQLKHTFTVSKNSRNFTPSSFVEIGIDGITGFGEGAMPPYLGESHESAAKFISKVNLKQFNDPLRLEEILDYVDKLDSANTAIKSAIDIALHDLVGKLIGLPCFRIWGYSKENTPYSSFTIGIDSEKKIKYKTEEAKAYKILKIKLGKANDKEILKAVRSIAPKTRLFVDVNGGWKDKHKALDMIYYLQENSVELIEQPMPKEKLDDIAWLSEKSPLPIIADESFQRWKDLRKLRGAYTGINIKLAKCTGMREAQKIINTAQGLGMKVMIGCMTESSCAISAAAQLSPIADWADLDGNLLLSNDIFKGVEIIDSKIILKDKPGIGAEKID